MIILLKIYCGKKLFYCYLLIYFIKDILKKGIFLIINVIIISFFIIWGNYIVGFFNYVENRMVLSVLFNDSLENIILR